MRVRPREEGLKKGLKCIYGRILNRAWRRNTDSALPSDNPSSRHAPQPRLLRESPRAAHHVPDVLSLCGTRGGNHLLNS